MRIPERTPEWLRRIHSLTGVVPLAVFLVEHITLNSVALAGPGAYREVVETVRRLPGVVWIEALGIGLPLLVHMTIGVLIATELHEEGNADASGWVAWSQRLTGVYLLNYVIFHTWGTRLSPDLLSRKKDLYTIMHEQVTGVGWFVWNALGVLSAAWHLGVGLPRFVARWWPRLAPGTLRAAAGVGYVLSAVLGIAGVAALTAFARGTP